MELVEVVTAAVEKFCNEREALLIADEALTGIGRTGRWFAFEHTDVVPDVVVTSKALGGGVPFSAVLIPASLATEALARGFLQAASHQGDPFQCAVALANLDVIEQEGLLARARRLGMLLGESWRSSSIDSGSSGRYAVSACSGESRSSAMRSRAPRRSSWPRRSRSPRWSAD